MDQEIYEELQRIEAEWAHRYTQPRLTAESLIDWLLAEGTDSADGLFMSMRNCRFVYSPDKRRMIFGGDNVSKGSHAEEAAERGITGDTCDRSVRGWVAGKAKGFPFGVIHFAPPIREGTDPEYFDASLQAIQYFVRMGATSKTQLRGFPGGWEQPLGRAVPELAGAVTEGVVPVNIYPVAGIGYFTQGQIWRDAEKCKANMATRFPGYEIVVHPPDKYPQVAQEWRSALNSGKVRYADDVERS